MIKPNNKAVRHRVWIISKKFRSFSSSKDSAKSEKSSHRLEDNVHNIFEKILKFRVKKYFYKSIIKIKMVQLKWKKELNMQCLQGLVDVQQCKKILSIISHQKNENEN